MDDQIDPVAVALNGAVARLHHVLRRMAARRGGPATLPDAQVELLRLVQRRPGISVKEAAEALRTAPNTVSTLVGDLAGAGLLRRDRDPGNRRVVRLELTEGAHQRLDEYLRRRQVILAEALATLDGRGPGRAGCRRTPSDAPGGPGGCRRRSAGRARGPGEA